MIKLLNKKLVSYIKSNLMLLKISYQEQKYQEHIFGVTNLPGIFIIMKFCQ